MKLAELHILQSFPPSCLNRDEIGAPKSAIFGGVKRSRISSQCSRRATRIDAARNSELFQGVRTRYLNEMFLDALIKHGAEVPVAERIAGLICEVLSKNDEKHPGQVTTCVFLSPAEVGRIAGACLLAARNILNKPEGDVPDEPVPTAKRKKDEKKDPLADIVAKEATKAMKSAAPLDAADIALFGRMIANDSSLNIEGASLFSHPISTHRSVNDVDFWTAVDDKKGDSGAAGMGAAEFSSATYYRFVALDLDLLFAPTHLGLLTVDEKKSVVSAFIRAALMAVPGAKKNSMNAATLPFEVLAILKDEGQPVQLVNAFEKPIPSSADGYASPSTVALKDELQKIKRIWSPKQEEVWLTEVGMGKFMELILAHVE